MGSDDTPKGTPEGRKEPAEPGPAQPGRAEPGPAQPEPGGGRASRVRRKPSLIAAAVAAAVLLAGGGGAYLVTHAGDSHGAGPAPGGEPEPLALDATGSASGPERGIAPGEPAPDGSGTVFRTSGPLPDGPDRAKVYRVSGAVARADVSALAQALKVPGKPELKQGIWIVGGSPDGGGPSLQVSRQAPGGWSYSRHTAGSFCPDATTCTFSVPPAKAAPGSGDGGGAAPAAGEAERAARPVLKAVGLQAAKLDSDQTLGSVRVVAADPKVDGLPTSGWRTELSIGPEGPVTGHGTLSELKPGDEYPTVSAKRALELLEKGPAGARDIAPCPPKEPKQPEPSASAVPPGEPAAPDQPARPGKPGEPGQPAERGAPQILPCEPGSSGPQEVRDAVFGLSAQSVGGQPALVPSWLFTVARPDSDITRTVVQVAVDPKYIQKPSAGKPGTEQPGTGKPSSGPAAPPSGGGSGEQPGGTGGTTRVHVESFSADDSTLTVHFWGGVCSDYSATADESKDQVKVQVTGKEKHPGRVCIMIAKKFTKQVKLDRPLGDRKVVDATTGDRVPKQK